jgi:lipopolysaccharide transport system permease protein
LSIYTLVYLFIFRMGTAGLDRLDYVIWLYAGLGIYLLFADVVVSSPASIRGNPNYVKKAVFPLEILVSSKCISAFVSFLVSFILLVILVAIKQHSVHLTLFLIPVVLVPTILFSYGLALMLSCVGVFIRDIDEVVRHLLRVLFYLTPIVYPMTLVPEKLHSVFWFNPLVSMVDHYRRVVVLGVNPEWDKLFLFFLFAVGFLYLGRMIFAKFKPVFADVI